MTLAITSRVAAHNNNTALISSKGYTDDCEKEIADGLEQAQQKKRQQDQKEIACLELKQVLAQYLLQRRGGKQNDANVAQYYWCGMFSFLPHSKSFTSKVNAITELHKALEGENDFDLNDDHLSVLRNGQLGHSLRTFIKQGKADALVGKDVHTVSDFVRALQANKPAAAQL